MRYAICRPVVESTRSAAWIRDVRRTGRHGGRHHFRLDGVANGVDTLGVRHLEVPGSPAEGLGDVPVGTGQRLQMGNDLPERGRVHLAGVGPDVALGQHGRVAGRVDGGHVRTAPLPLLRDPGGAGEQVKGGHRSGPFEHLTQHGDQPAFGAQVLDQRVALPESGGQLVEHHAGQQVEMTAGDQHHRITPLFVRRSQTDLARHERAPEGQGAHGGVIVRGELRLSARWEACRGQSPPAPGARRPGWRGCCAGRPGRRGWPGSRR